MLHCFFLQDLQECNVNKICDIQYQKKVNKERLKTSQGAQLNLHKVSETLTMKIEKSSTEKKYNKKKARDVMKV